MNVLGWKDWKVIDSELKGPDYRIVAEHAVRPERCDNEDCSSERFHIHERRKAKAIRDTKIHGKRVGIDAVYFRWKCAECEAEWTVRPPELDARRRMTKRLVEVLGDESFRRRFSDLAWEYGVSASTVANVFNKELKKRKKNWTIDPPEVLGIDEIHLSRRRFVAANLGTSPAALVEILEDRNQATVEKFLKETDWVQSTEIVAMDMWNPYRAAVRNSLGAMIVVDKFHLLMLANRIVDRERDELVRYGAYEDQQRLRGSREILRGRRKDLGAEDLDKLEEWRMWYPSLMATYDLKEAIHKIYAARDRQEAEERMEWWKAQVPESLEEVFKGPLRALEAWREEILNYFYSKEVTNAGTETLNRFIRLTWELGNGYGFEALRGKMLFASERLKTKYWEMQGPPLRTGGDTMGFSLGVGGKKEKERVVGADLEALISAMEERTGEWSDPGLWKE